MKIKTPSQNKAAIKNKTGLHKPNVAIGSKNVWRHPRRDYMSLAVGWLGLERAFVNSIQRRSDLMRP